MCSSSVSHFSFQETFLTQPLKNLTKYLQKSIVECKNTIKSIKWWQGNVSYV